LTPLMSRTASPRPDLTPPPCHACSGALSLATAIDGFGDRPKVYVFKCAQCARLVTYFLDNGRLRKW
jgi:hypothetical protein